LVGARQPSDHIISDAVLKKAAEDGVKDQSLGWAVKRRLAECLPEGIEDVGLASSRERCRAGTGTGQQRQQDQNGT
jgi:hypothetical protein